jgi:hypothetical protein
MSIFEKHHSRIACATSDNISIPEKKLLHGITQQQFNLCPHSPVLIAKEMKGRRCSTLQWKGEALPVFSSMSLEVGPQEAGADSIEESIEECLRVHWTQDRVGLKGS